MFIAVRALPAAFDCPDVLAFDACEFDETHSASELRSAFPEYKIEECYGDAYRERVRDLNILNMAASFAVMGMRSRRYNDVRRLAQEMCV